MAATNVPPNLQTTTTDGDANGYLTFADVSKYVPFARASLRDSSGLNPVDVFLTSVDTTAQKVGVVFVSSLPDNYGRSDVSAYLAGSTLNQWSPQISNLVGPKPRVQGPYPLFHIFNPAGVPTTQINNPIPNGAVAWAITMRVVPAPIGIWTTPGSTFGGLLDLGNTGFQTANTVQVFWVVNLASNTFEFSATNASGTVQINNVTPLTPPAARYQFDRITITYSNGSMDCYIDGVFRGHLGTITSFTQPAKLVIGGTLGGVVGTSPYLITEVAISGPKAGNPSGTDPTLTVNAANGEFTPINLAASTAVIGGVVPNPGAPEWYCGGDSNTEVGLGLPSTFPQLLNGLVGPTVNVINNGHSGNVAAQIKTSYDNARAAYGQPYQLVTIQAGTNDIWANSSSAASTLTTLTALWDEIRADGSQLVVVTIPPAVGCVFDTGGGTQQTQALALNTGIRNYAAANPNTGLYDLYAALNNGSGALAAAYDGGDHLHISQAAAVLWAAGVNATRVAPSAPTIGTATGGNAQAIVTWTAPAPGAPVGHYSVVSSPATTTQTFTSSPATFTGLTNGVAYTFSVSTVNAYGTSAASAASNSVTPATFTPPTNVTFTSTDLLNAAWSGDPTPVQNVTGPQGQTAWTVGISGFGVHRLSGTLTGNSTTFQVIAKAGTLNFLGYNDPGTGANCAWDLSGGTVFSQSGCTATIVPAGSGWFLCKAVIAGSTFAQRFLPADTGANAVIGGPYSATGNVLLCNVAAS